MRIEIDIPEHQYNNIMAFDSVNLGRMPYKGIIMYAINAIKQGKVLEQEPTTKNNLGVDCISRDAVLKPYEGLKDEDTISVWLIRKNIEQQPFVKQEPRKGHWIDTDEWRETVDGFEQWGYFRKCSKCGYVFKFLEIDNYCPNCGAKMVESQEK